MKKIPVIPKVPFDKSDIDDPGVARNLFVTPANSRWRLDITFGTILATILSRFFISFYPMRSLENSCLECRMSNSVSLIHSFIVV